MQREFYDKISVVLCSTALSSQFSFLLHLTEFQVYTYTYNSAHRKCDLGAISWIPINLTLILSDD